MKDFLLLIIGGAILVAVFADGGLELSPTISPAFDARLAVEYSPSVTTTNIETNIERQQTTIIYQDAPGAGAGSGEYVRGVNLVAGGPGRCATQPGDQIESEQGNGACFVVASDGQRYFINPSGGRWPADDGRGAGAEPALVPLATPAALVQPGELTLAQLQAAFLRNGGALPWFWNMRSDDDKRTWLTQQGETWR